ncbi:MAG: hypothetical protein IJX81_05695 [Clostridia bacterium]|nr:hypothetical protein [Clostridia bacterium]
MVIDIINYTNDQFAALTGEQVLEVKRVQLSKNRLTRKLEEKKKAERFRLLKAGIFCSGIWTKICEELDAEYGQEVENLREGLLFYLEYGGSAGQEQESSSPYTVDYSLDGFDRAVIVRDYYLGAYDNAIARYAAFKEDTVAKSYLGEYYSGLHDYLKNLADTSEEG